MDERLRFVARLLEGEKMAVLCREFDISRKTGYKIFARYKDCGLEGPHRSLPTPLPASQPLAVADRGADRPAQARAPRAGAPPRSARSSGAGSTICRICRPSALSTPCSIGTGWSAAAAAAAHATRPKAPPCPYPTAPNDLWCADYKGEFMLVDRRYCYPLTITDFASRYLLCCDAQSSTQMRYAFTVFERAFKDFGLPRAIRTDNGAPFASTSAFFGLSKLSVWWLRLGIAIERIQPRPSAAKRAPRTHAPDAEEGGHPPRRQELPAAAGALRSASSHDFNHERPHQALGMNYPAELYGPSPRPYRGLPELRLPAARPYHHRHPLRATVLRLAQDQPQPGLRRADRRGARSRRSRLARQLHALRPRLLRSRVRPRRVRAEPLRG